jgi:hypothetical protein
MIDDIFVSVGLPFTTIALSTCLNALVLPLPSKSNSKKKKQKTTYNRGKSFVQNDQFQNVIIINVSQPYMRYSLQILRNLI